MIESIADRYRRRAAHMTETVAAVASDRWEISTPCEEWTARDLVRHLVDTQAMFAGFIDRSFEPGPSLADDPLGAWIAARDQTQAALDDPAVAALEFDGFTGRSTFESAADRFLSFDLVAHRWDLARAAGIDEQIPPDDLAALQVAIEEMSETMGQAMRSPGAFGPELEPPGGADQQTRVLAFIGRRSW